MHHRQWTGIVIVETFYHLLQFTFCILLITVVSKNYLWNIFFLFICAIDFLQTFFFIYSVENVEINPAETIPILQWVTWWSKNTSDKKTLWLVIQNVLWVFLILLWLRPAFLYSDMLGGTFLGKTSHSKESSCTNARFSLSGEQCSQPFGRTIIYNPKGVFNSPNTGYDEQGIYSTCPMNQRWANATFGCLGCPGDGVWVGGYNVDSQKNLICEQPKVGGEISRYNCPGTKQCDDAYPGLWYGVKLQTLSSETLPNNTQGLIEFCPSTIPIPISVPPYVKGVGKYVCSYCLFYLIYIGAIFPDIGGPLSQTTQCLPGWNGVSTTPPNSWQGWKPGDSSLGCALCPSRGAGWGMVKDELYGEENIIDSYWFSTTVAFFFPILRKLLSPLATLPPRKKHKIKNKENIS